MSGRDRVRMTDEEVAVFLAAHRKTQVASSGKDGTEYAELRGVSVNGTAEIVDEPARVLEIGSAVATRMLGVNTLAELGDLGRAEVERQAAKRVAVVVHPSRAATWDHSKLG